MSWFFSNACYAYYIKPKAASPAFADLLEGLLSKFPSTRLGGLNGTKEIQDHPFFQVN